MSSSAAPQKPVKATDASKEKGKGKAKSKPATKTLPNRTGWKPACDMCGTDFDDFDPTKGMRCNDCAVNVAEWDGAESWVDLLDYNRDFIEGARTQTPYSIFPLFTDDSLWPGLFTLHDFGILVTDAQPEYHKIGFDEEKRTWFEIKERAYLRCVIPTNLKSVPIAKVENMLDLLFTNPLTEAVMYYEYTDYFAGKWMGEVEYRCALPVSARNLSPAKIPKHHFFRSSVGPSITGRTVSKHRVADTKEGLVWQKWKRCKHKDLPVITEKDLAPNSQGLRAFGRATKLTTSLLPVIFTIVVREWAEMGLDLAEIIRCACEDAGMEPLFAELEDTKEATVAGGTDYPQTAPSGAVPCCEACASNRPGSLPVVLEKLSVDEVD